MSPASRSGEMTGEEETNRLLAIIIRQNSTTQQHAIEELGKSGFGPTRISELLGTSVATAKVTLQRARKSAGKPARKSPGGGD